MEVPSSLPPMSIPGFLIGDERGEEGEGNREVLESQRQLEERKEEEKNCSCASTLGKVRCRAPMPVLSIQVEHNTRFHDVARKRGSKLTRSAGRREQGRDIFLLLFSGRRERTGRATTKSDFVNQSCFFPHQRGCPASFFSLPCEGREC